VRKIELPVLVLLYNRPDLTSKLLDSLSETEGLRIYAAIDGPRSDADRIRTDAVADILANSTTVPFQKVWKEPRNLGCGPGVALALQRFFNEVEFGVVLEDDCIPTPEFFDYCRWGLGTFSGDARVGVISGINYVPPLLRDRHSQPVYLSRYPQIWGWATWANRIKGYSHRSEMRRGSLVDSPQWRALSPLERLDWTRRFHTSRTVAWKHSWSVQLVHHLWRNNFYSLAPPTSLVSNKGFGSEATHTSGPAPAWYSDPVDGVQRRELVALAKSMNAAELAPNLKADKWTSAKFFSPPINERLRRRIRSLG